MLDERCLRTWTTTTTTPHTRPARLPPAVVTDGVLTFADFLRVPTTHHISRVTKSRAALGFALRRSPPLYPCFSSPPYSCTAPVGTAGVRDSR